MSERIVIGEADGRLGRILVINDQDIKFPSNEKINWVRGCCGTYQAPEFVQRLFGGGANIGRVLLYHGIELPSTVKFWELVFSLSEGSGREVVEDKLRGLSGKRVLIDYGEGKIYTVEDDELTEMGELKSYL